MRDGTPLRGLSRDKKAMSPAISSTIMTAAIIVMVLVTMVFANNYLNSRMAENEFSAMKQFMQTAALQIDDVAWTIGRTQTVRYASQFGQLSFQSVALKYVVYVNHTDTWIANFTVGALMFNMPTTRYNIANNFVENILPSSGSSFLLQGTSAPVTRVFVIERVPMNDGNYIRVVVAPSIRMLNSTISTGTATPTNYYNCYLPILQQGNNLYRSQSVTLVSTNVTVTTVQNIDKIKIILDFPKSGLGFDSSFFNFNSTHEEAAVPTGSILEFYTGNVTVSLGLYS
jgi:hypothetical protein